MIIADVAITDKVVIMSYCDFASFAERLITNRLVTWKLIVWIRKLIKVSISDMSSFSQRTI